MQKVINIWTKQIENMRMDVNIQVYRTIVMILNKKIANRNNEDI